MKYLNKILFICIVLLFSCRNKNIFLDVGFVNSKGFSGQLLTPKEGVKMALRFENNPFSLSDKDSITISFNNYSILNTNYNVVNKVIIPFELLNKSIQSSLLIKKNNEYFFYLYEGYDFFISKNEDTGKAIFITFSNDNMIKQPYSLKLK